MLTLASSAHAQAPGGPPSVGVVKAEQTAITETSEFIGRVQAINRVALTARVTAFLDQRFFTEGAEVKQGDLLYRLEQAPFQAVVEQQEAAVADNAAKLVNANIQLARAQALLNTPAGQRSSVDDSTANQRSAAAQLQSAQAALKTAQINLAYTEIRAPVAGKISRTSITEGNVVSPSTGALATIVSQDPMYVTFAVPTRTLLTLRARYEPKGGFKAVVIKLRLPNGQIYAQEGRPDYLSPTISANTDSAMVRAVVPNPLLPGLPPTGPAPRELFDGEFVTVLGEGVQPITVLAVPRAAVLSDQQGDYVYVVDAQSRAQQRRIQLGQSTPSTAVITAGLSEGELVITEGLQRVRPDEKVSASPATPQPSAAAER
jgi:membrane fusion protein (multidrug efflux system)